MTSDRKRPGVAFWAIAAVGMALMGYVSAYALMVRLGPAVINLSGGRDLVAPITAQIPPFYCAGTLLPPNQQLFEGFFPPIHWIDRRVRPNAWNWRFPD